jgi:hypothetical protein
MRRAKAAIVPDGDFRFGDLAQVAATGAAADR